jgi:hypothetical protein
MAARVRARLLSPERGYILAGGVGIRKELCSSPIEIKGLNMKAATIVGIVLTVFGIIGFALGGITFTHEKKDVNLGPLQISHKEHDTLPISPVLSTISLVAGVGLVVVGMRSR